MGTGVGELTLLTVAAGPGALALAVVVAMLVARALGGVRIVIAQASVGAILIIGPVTPRPARKRLIDARLAQVSGWVQPDPVHQSPSRSCAERRQMSRGGWPRASS